MRGDSCPKVRKARSASPASRPAAPRTLPQDLQETAVARLALVALLVAVFSVVMRLAVPEVVSGPALRTLASGAFFATVLGSLTVAALAWRPATPPPRLLSLGLVYEVVQAFLFAVYFHAQAVPPGTVARGWSPVAVWILAFPLIVPATRGRAAAATVLAALMEPAGLAVAVAAGNPLPPGRALAATLLQTGLSLVASLLLSRMVRRLSTDVVDAREMGSYRLVERIGEGGMGEVWRAEHRTLARPAAIKLIRPEALAGQGRNVPDAIARFEREARATAALRSPHTVAVYDFGAVEDGSLYYVMELLDGYDLETLVRRFGPLPSERVVLLIRQVCHSLEEAHRAGMVHRDVKPANILACRYGLELDFVKVLDFGLVKGSGGPAAGDAKLTSAGIVAGTPEYISPEAARGEAGVDWRSDIYSLGCVAYWMLTGKAVFDVGSTLKVVFDHAETPPVPPSRRTDRVIPRELEQIVLECLAKDPRHRPQTAGELAERLAALGIEDGWDRRRAEIWWRDHPPESADAIPREVTGRSLALKTA